MPGVLRLEIFVPGVLILRVLVLDMFLLGPLISEIFLLKVFVLGMLLLICLRDAFVDVAYIGSRSTIKRSRIHS